MSRLAARLLRWYAANGRRLPWRGKKSPYQVWVSEIMLQQTRVDAVVPYYRRWMKRFPTVTSLAQASQRDVLRQWEGLGYYARARNLHQSAKVVVDEYLGRLPSRRHDLLALPGIGDYTAGAISSIAFGLDEPVLDGNIRRVLARLFAIAERVDSSAGTAILHELAVAHLPRGRAGEFNQALMDLGATVCLPARPRCGICPLASVCEANRLGMQGKFPILRPRQRIPHLALGAVVALDRKRVLIARRQSKGLLGGMWEFPTASLGSEAGPRGSFEPQFVKELHKNYGLRLGRHRPLITIEHAYSHFRVTVQAYRCKIRPFRPRPGMRWTSIRDLSRFPMGRVDRQIADKLQV